jgi:hypothetical protein
MANAIIEVARMPTAAWRAMSDEAYTMATAYTWDDAADHFEAALKDAVAAARGPDELQRGNRSSSIIHV